MSFLASPRIRLIELFSTLPKSEAGKLRLELMRPDAYPDCVERSGVAVAIAIDGETGEADAINQVGLAGLEPATKGL